MGARITVIEQRLGDRIDSLDNRIGATERRYGWEAGSGGDLGGMRVDEPRRFVSI